MPFEMQGDAFKLTTTALQTFGSKKETSLGDIAQNVTQEQKKYPDGDWNAIVGSNFDTFATYTTRGHSIRIEIDGISISCGPVRATFAA